MAYTALKFCGINPGHRLNARTNINSAGNAYFPFTPQNDTSSRSDVEKGRSPTVATQETPGAKSPAHHGQLRFSRPRAMEPFFKIVDEDADLLVINKPAG